MTGVVIKRKCENCNSVVDQGAFFKELENEQIALEKWTELCPLCKHPLKKPTEEELRTLLFVNGQVFQNQFSIMQTQFAIISEIRQLRQETANLQATHNALIKGLNSLEKISEALTEQSESFKKSMDEHMKLIGVFNKGIHKVMKLNENLRKEFKKESESRTEEVVKALNRLENTFKAAVDEATKN